jgi:hypothetical protein
VDHVTATSRRWAALLSAATVGTLILTTVLTGRTPARRAACVGTLIPAYLPPAEIEQLVTGDPGARVLIVNPANGPGEAGSRAYRRAIARARASGAQVLGYVPTTYAARPEADVEADVARYRDWYGVDGIFLDEVTHDDAHLPYYSSLSHRVRSGGLLVLNPGTVPARGYFALADVVVTFEGPYAEYAARLAQQPEWLDEIAPAQTAHLVYATSKEQAIALFAAPARAGSLYVTAGALPNPWGTPPPYLREEQSAIASTDQRNPTCAS